MQPWSRSLALAALLVASAGCGRAPTAPTPGHAPPVETLASAQGAATTPEEKALGAETPPFNLQVVLRPAADGTGFGLVKFRQPNDGMRRVYLDPWVRDLAPNAEFYLQRAVDSALDGVCTGNGWLTLGQGLTPQALVTDATGTARGEFYRDLPAAFVRQMFDIHFRIITAAGVAVLQSGCYQYVVEPD